MANRQHMQPNRALMARLHAACLASPSRSAIGMGKTDTGDYLIEGIEKSPKRSTLGSSINYNPADA